MPGPAPANRGSAALTLPHRQPARDDHRPPLGTDHRCRDSGRYRVSLLSGEAIQTTPLIEARISQAADQACVSAQQNGEGDGVCQLTFAAARAFVDNLTPLGQSKQFGCLLNLLCIADVGPEDQGTCNTLLAEAGKLALRDSWMMFLG